MIKVQKIEKKVNKKKSKPTNMIKKKVKYDELLDLTLLFACPLAAFVILLFLFITKQIP